MSQAIHILSWWSGLVEIAITFQRTRENNYVFYAKYKTAPNIGTSSLDRAHWKQTKRSIRVTYCRPFEGVFGSQSWAGGFFLGPASTQKKPPARA